MLLATYVVLTAAAAFFVLLPLFRVSESGLEIELMAETEIDRLMDRKTAIYRNLKDLSLEYAMGRLSEEDYRGLEEGYKEDAAAILYKIEQFEGSIGVEQDAAPKAALKREVRAGTRPSPVSGKCPSCGSDIIPGKKFCADCGQQLAEDNQ
jgi:hypothetical protein